VLRKGGTEEKLYLFWFIMAFRTRQINVVGTGARLWAGWLGVQICAGAGNFSVLNVQTGSGGYPASYLIGPGVPSCG
jgi:hypothetical protein